MFQTTVNSKCHDSPKLTSGVFQRRETGKQSVLSPPCDLNLTNSRSFLPLFVFMCAMMMYVLLL